MSFYDSTGDHTGSMNGEIIGGGCMSDTEILLLALDRDEASRPNEHLRKCAKCNARVENLRRIAVQVAAVVGEESPSAVGRPLCLDELALTRLLGDGEQSSATAEEIAHLSGCAFCRGELASLAALLGDANIAPEIRASEIQGVSRLDQTRRAGSTAKRVAMLAAAAVVLLIGWPAGQRWLNNPSNGTNAAVHRGPTITAAGAPRSLSPVGDIATGRSFLWTAVSGSDRYRLTLYDRAGHVLYEAQVGDTTLVLPDSVVLARGIPYVWQVEARTGVDRWTSSDVAEFVVAANGAR